MLNQAACFKKTFTDFEKSKLAELNFVIFSGEDKLSLLLTNTTSPTPVHGVPAEEGARRKAVQKTSILLKVRFNGKQVFLTDPRPLSTDFKLHFGLIFRIRIVQWPESLKVGF